MTLDATVVANDRMLATLAGGVKGMLPPRCFPPMPSMTVKATTLGIHAMVSNLS